jgi:transcriptional regulator with XRE-family HTH domain
MGKVELGAYVGERRKKQGLRQSDLADALGYTNQAISKFESGASSISILLLPDLANLLGLSLDDLVARNPNPAAFPPKNPKADPLKQQNNLSFLRQKENLSQKEFADILDVSPRSVLNYENGDTVLSFASLERLLDHFDLKASDFFNTDLKLKAAPVAAVESAPSANPRDDAHSNAYGSSRGDAERSHKRPPAFFLGQRNLHRGRDFCPSRHSFGSDIAFMGS